MVVIKRSQHLDANPSGAVTLVSIEGDVTIATVPRLVDGLNREVTSDGGRTIVVDLDSVGVLDDTGLGVLLGFASRVRATGRSVAIVASVDRVNRRLAETRLDHAVPVASSVAEAVRRAS